MTEWKYFMVGIIFSLLLMLGVETVYAKGPVEVIAYADDTIGIVTNNQQTARIIEQYLNQSETVESAENNTPAEAVQKPVDSQVVQKSVNAMLVNKPERKIAMHKPVKHRLLSRKELNEGGAKMFKRIFLLPMMYSNIRKK